MSSNNLNRGQSPFKTVKKLSISNKILTLVLFIFALFTFGISIIIGINSFDNLTSITVGQLDRMSRILAIRLTEMEENAVRITKNFEENHRVLEQIMRITYMGPYYTLDRSSVGKKIDDPEKIYMFQAQMNLIPILQSLQHLNDLNSISFYLLSPFNIIPNAKPVLAIRVDKDSVYVGSFDSKGDSNKRAYISIPVKSFRPAPPDYFDISSVYSLAPETFYEERGFSPTDSPVINEILPENNEEFSKVKKKPHAPISKMIIQNGSPVIRTWYSVMAPLPEQSSYKEELALTGIVVVEQYLNNDKMLSLKSELGVDLGIALNSELLTGTLWEAHEKHQINSQETVLLNQNEYYYSQKEILFSNGATSFFHAVVFSPVSTLTKLTNDLFFSILFVGFVAMCLMGAVIYFAFRKLVTKPLRDLMNGVRMLATGELDHTVNIHSEDELGQLARAFNNMTGKIDKAQTYIKNIIDSMPSVLIGVDESGKVTQWNRLAEQETKVQARDAKNKYLADVFPRLKSETEKIQTAMIDQQTLVYNKVVHIVDDETHYEDITIYPLITKEVEGAVIRIDDVTEHVRLEEIMIQSEKMMSVGGLAAGMAHEINNPLAGMMQNSSSLINRLTSDLPGNDKVAAECGTNMKTIREFMEKRGIITQLELIHKSGIRAADIVGNMLSFARKSESKSTLIDIRNLLDKTVELAENDYSLKKKYDFRQIEVSKEYQENMPSVVCEAGKIQQVFFNILKNGAEAMSENVDKSIKSRFILRISTLESMARIEIENNGPAIDEATRKRIFEPFFTTKGVGVGTGLGLSVSYFIITENHGGTLSVESAANKGTKFIIQLPVN